MREGILVINAGSSSIKFSLYISEGNDPPLLSCKGQVEGINVAPHFIAKAPHGGVLNEQRWPDQPNMSHEALFKYMIDWIEAQLGDAELKAAGHRVVHGGSQYSQPLLVTDELMEELERLIPLAPLHQPHNLAPIRALTKVHPNLPQVACFDTAFHRSNPWTAQSFALPRKITGEGVKRYGFHGLSYEYIARQLRKLSPATARGKVIVCHLGSGASMCAIDGGKSVASTMGFTAVDGLVMGTRTGSLDPGVLLYLMQERAFDAKGIEDLIYRRSGLLGVSGISSDMRTLRQSTAPEAAEAIALFVYRIVREIGSLAAALGGLDGVVFTAGIGENDPATRAEVAAGCGWLGLALDPARNAKGPGPIGKAGGKVAAWVVPTDEERMIARYTGETLGL